MWYDVVVLGGGIHGCGCAAEAAMRGLSVLLCEQDDLAAKTSSNSSKLIHGGLRYLEHYDFSMVKKAMHEQQILLQRAPYLVHPLPFVLPQDKHGRSKWLLRAGLFLYDHLRQKDTLPNSQWITRSHYSTYFNPLQDSFRQGFVYYDCRTNDARLTITNALLAKQHGATILTQTEFTHATTTDNYWRLTLKPRNANPIHIKARTVINACGPWVEQVSQRLGIIPQYNLTLVKGSHLLLPKLYQGEHAYVLQQPDARIVFAIPYNEHTLLGTTEVSVKHMQDESHITEQEIEYLCNLAQQAFKQPIKTSDILHTFCGVRSVVAQANSNISALSRDYMLQNTQIPAPAINLFGGKLTTYRALAQQAIDNLQTYFPTLSKSSSAHMPLPGTVEYPMQQCHYEQTTRQRYSWLDNATLNRYLNTYGTLTDTILNNVTKPEDLGRCIAPTVYQCELDYLQQEEWAKTTTDVLWRRTQLGMLLNQQQQATVAKAMHDDAFTLKTS